MKVVLDTEEMILFLHCMDALFATKKGHGSEPAIRSTPYLFNQALKLWLKRMRRPWGQMPIFPQQRVYSWAERIMEMYKE
jgi:hypothetical protein